MALNYEEYSQLTRSQKITLCTIEAKHQRKLFTGSPVYSATTEHFVCGVTVDGQELSRTTTLPTSGQYRYNPEQGTVEIRLAGDENPATKTVFFKYRFFFSSIPVTFSSEYSNDVEVNWDARLKSGASLKLELDYEQTGTVLETNSQIQLENTDGYFDDIFDTLIWEGQKVNVYSWSELLPSTEMKLFYRGKVDSKSFSTAQVNFNVRDQVNDLREKVPYTVFSALDGRVADNVINKPKRKIFGQLEKVKLVGIDNVLTGYPVTGTYIGSADRNLLTGRVSGNIGSSTITGNGTQFLTEIFAGQEILIIDGVFEYVYEVLSVSSNTSLTITSTLTATFTNAIARNKDVLNNKVIGTGTNFKTIFSPDDEITAVIDGIEYTYGVEEVVSDTELTLSDEIEVTFTSMGVKPAVPYRGFNRNWHIAGHKLRSTTKTVVTVIDELNYELDSVDELNADDILIINGNFRKIIRVTGNKVRLNQSLIGVLVGDQFIKTPVSQVYIGTEPLVTGRDFTVSNTTTDAIVQLSTLAEFNIAKTRSLSITFQFVNGSDVVTALSTDRDLTNIFKPRDWIRSKDVTHQVWYEVLSVDQLQMRLRVPYAGSNFTSQLNYKSPDYVDDSSLVTANCIGMEDVGTWIRTPSQVVKQLLNSANITALNTASFTEAESDCAYTMSLLLPQQPLAEMPSIRDAITLVNKSCFGSLYFDSEFNFTYKILNSDKPENLQSVKDEDILGFSVQTKNQILGTVKVNYRPFTDIVSGSDSFNQITTSSDFVAQTSEVKSEQTFTSFIFDAGDAQTIAERWRFFRSLSQSVVKVQAKTNFMLKSLNEPVFLDLERLYRRYGGNGRKKIGLINAVDKDGESSTITFNDLGNIFNRVGSIAPDTQVDYSFSNSDEIAKYCYIVDNVTETPNPSSEEDLGNNLIG